jgi:hypothetical protein
MGKTFNTGTLVNGLSVLSNGNVGIGVASPSTTLHLSTTNGIRLQYTGNTGFIQFSTNGSNDYIFSGFDGERMRMTSAGSLGLGTTNPQAFFHMSLTGNSTRLRMEAGATYAALLDFYNSTTARWSIGIDNTQTYGKLENRVLATDAIRFYDSSNNVVLVPSSGRVGIGTTSPNFTLDVNTSSSNSVFEATTSFTHTTGYLDHSTFLAPNMTGGALSVSFGKSASNYNTGKIVFNYAGNNSTSNSVGLGFYNADNILVVRGDGTVGIGTTNPAGQLSGTTGLSIVHSLYPALGLSNGTNNWLNYLAGTTYRIWNNSINEAMTILLNGNVGIGTVSPAYKLEVSSGVPDVLRVINTGSATGNNPTAQFLNTHGNHSWGICAEFRVGSSGGSDRASILFSHAYDSNTWGIGFGYNDSSYFRINRDQGPYGGGWGVTLFSLDRSGNYSFSGSNVSDRRNKKDIVYVVDSQMDTILKLRPATFVKKSPGKDEYSEHTHTGFIAQDILEENIPNLVHGSEEKGYGLDYDGILALAVKAIQELKAEIEILKNK